MPDCLQALTACMREQTPAVWVSVAQVRGSTPREPGTKMLVTENNLYGTIGGGNLEFKAVEIARELLAKINQMSLAPDSQATELEPSLRRFPLGPSLGQCCGGVAELLFEPLPQQPTWLQPLSDLMAAQTPTVMVTPVATQLEKLLVTATECIGQWPDAALQAKAITLARGQLTDSDTAAKASLYQLSDSQQVLFELLQTVDFHIDVYGAGHVGKALIQVLSALPCRIRWIDSRAEQFPAEQFPAEQFPAEQFPAAIPSNVEIIISDAPELEADDAPVGSYVLVMTHSHPLDQAICERYLRRGGYRYLGLIGSASKKRKFEQRLRRCGISMAQWNTLTCPIGIAGIEGKHPAEIAITVAAQLLQIRQSADIPITEKQLTEKPIGGEQMASV